MDEFDAVWVALQSALQPGIEIKNWNAYNGYLGDNLTVKEVAPDWISIDPPRVWGTRVISRDNFAQVWALWPDYKALHLKRSEFRALNEHARYIISILRWYETTAQRDGEKNYGD